MFFLVLISVSYAEPAIVPVKLTLTEDFLRAKLDFFDQERTGNYNLSVILSDAADNLVANATINGTIIDPDGMQTPVNFTETAAGNYTKEFNLSKIGDYAIQISAAKTGFANISGSKTIYVGLVKFVSFAGSDVFQDTTAFFDLTVQNKGTVSSNVVPLLRVFDSDGNLAFSKDGFSTAVTANQTVSFFQHNILTWNVGKTSAGTYTARAGLSFTDHLNITRFTPNLSFAFQANAEAAEQAPAAGGGGTTIIVKNVTETPETVRLFHYSNIPVLVETYPGNTLIENIIVYNPNDGPINDILISIEGVPESWLLIDKTSFGIGPGDSEVVSIVFSMPGGAVPGNYQGIIRLESPDLIRESSFILRINPGMQSGVTISKTGNLRETSGRTEFIITVKASKPVESFRIIENINKSIASHVDDIEFSPPPTRILQPDPIVEWVFDDLANGEEQNITYRVRKVINNTRPFILSSIEQVITVEAPDKPAKDSKVAEYSGMLIAILMGLVVVLLIIIYRSRTSRIHDKINEAKRFLRELNS